MPIDFQLISKDGGITNRVVWPLGREGPVGLLLLST